MLNSLRNTLLLSRPVTKGVLVTNRLQIATNVALNVPTPYTCRRTHYASPQGDISALQFLDVAYYIGGSFVIANPGATYTIKKFVEYPQNVFTQVTWAGATSVVVALGGAVQKSDPVSIIIPKGAKFWERTVHISATTKDMPAFELPAVPTALGLDDGNAASDLGNSGTISASSGNITSFGSIAIIGTVAKANARSFVVWGDSIAWGQGDITGSGATGGSGYISRGLDAKYPSMKLAKPGAATFNFVTDVATYATLLAAIGYTDVYCEHGGGDLRQGQSVAQILADLQTLYALSSGKRIYQATFLPRTDSTDGYVTTVNQTAKTDGNWSLLSTLNAAVRTPQAHVTACVETADIAMTSRDSGIWKAPPAASTDGVHPNSTEAAVLSAAVAPAIG